MGAVNAQIHAVDANGNLCDLQPKTTISNVSGLQSELNSKVNKVKVGSTSYSPSSGVVSLPAYPTTLPASDVSSWAKASSKPTYTASEVGAATSSHTHGLSLAADTGTSSIALSANTKYKLTAGGSTYVFTTPPDNNTTYSSKSAASGGTDVSLCTTGEKYTWNSKANGSHTHSYAGSSSAGGAATSANKLNTNAGSATQPVYFSNGVPAATTYSLSKSVPSNAVFTDTHRAIKVDGTQVLASNSTALNFIGTGHVHVEHDSSNPGNITFYEENWLTFVDLEVTLGDLTWTASSSSPGMYYSGNVSVYRTGTKPAFSFILGASILDFNAIPAAFISVGLSGTSSIWFLANSNSFQSYTKLNLRIFGLISFGEA